jgi:hypothetical protein
LAAIPNSSPSTKVVMAEEFTATPVEEFTATPVEPLKRVSNPIKQGIAGLTDIATYVPAAFGMVGSGLQAGYNTLINPMSAAAKDAMGVASRTDEFKRNFGKAISDEGIDQSLINISEAAVKGVNRLLNIKDPVSTEDQIARTIGGFFPVPGIGLAAGAGRLAKLALLSFNLLTPAVKRGPGFAKRSAAQVGIGLGATQGVRAFMDDPQLPLMFSKEALAGQPIPDQHRAIATPPELVGVSGEDALEGGAGDDILEEFTATPVDAAVEEFTATSIEEISSDVVDGTSAGLKEVIDLDRRVEKAQAWEDTKFWMMVVGGVLAGGAAVKWARNGRTTTLGQDIVNTPSYLHKQFMDRSGALEEGLRQVGKSEAAIAKAVHNSHADPIDIATNFENTARFGQGYVIPQGMRSWVPTQLRAEEVALGAERGQLFREAMLAQTQRATIANAVETADNAALFRIAQSRIAGQDNTIARARADLEIKALMDKHRDNYEVLLDYAKYRGVETTDTIAEMTGRSILHDVPGGRVAYMPIYAKNNEGFFARQARNFLGINSRQGRIASVPKEYDARGINIAELDEVLDPVTAQIRYARSTIAHANTEAYKGGILDALAGITRTKGGTMFRTADDEGIFSPLGKDSQYIGKGTDFTDIDNIHIDVETAPGFNLKGEFKSGSINDLRAKYGDEIRTVHQGGELRVYHVPDKGLQAVSELNTHFSPFLKVLSNWKNLFTQLTTGQASLFAPASGMFSIQQLGMNIAAKEGLWTGIKSIGHSLKGVQRLMVDSGSGVIARHLAMKIGKQLGEGRVPTEALKGMERRLSRRFQDAVMNQVQSETGRTVTSPGNIGHGTMDEILDVVGPAYSKFYPADQLGLAKELWKTWNSAWHEGPAYGVMLRKIGEAGEAGLDPTSTKVIREAVDYSKTVAGDMRRIGASRFAKGFTASMPFSSAMLQSWNSIGGAIKSNPIRFIAGVSALIGVPTMTELGNNALLSATYPGTFKDTNGKDWTYDDYYWNGFTTQQRVDNFIYFVPGRPPWDAIIVPVSPEWALFRATVLEGADAVFGLSDIGDIGEVDQKKVNRSMFIGALIRVFDLPLPPLLAATASSLGMDVRVGLAVEVKDDPDDPGTSVTFLRAHPIGGGERITRRSGKSRFAQGDLDRNVAAMIQDIFGAAGTMYINIHEAFMAGIRGREGSIGQGLSMGVDALGQSMKQSARYVQPLLGKALRPNASDEIAQTLFVSRKNLKRISDQLRQGFMGAGLVYADGQKVVGQMPLPDDPINLELAASVQGLSSGMAHMDKEISTLKKKLATAGNAVNLGSIRERNDLMDGMTLRIQTVKAMQLAMIHDFEEKASTYLTKRYKREIEIDLSSFVPRADAREGSTLKELLTSPPSSRSRE